MFNMYQLQLYLLFFISALSSATAGNECPDDSYVFKEINGTKKCYNIYRLPIPAKTSDRCRLKDMCRSLHPDAIPTPINSEEELEFIKTLALKDQMNRRNNAETCTLVGVYIPCPKAYDLNAYVNVDGSPLPVNSDIDEVELGSSDEFNAILHKAGDPGNNLMGYFFDNIENKTHVMCSINLNLRKSPCPDDSYVYHEINGIGMCYKVYKTPSIDRCNLINACRSLNPEAIPATIHSIKEREYLKSLVNPKEYTAIGVSIPCPGPYNVHNYKNIDGTPLPAPLEVTTGTSPDQYIGMLYNNFTDNLDPSDPEFHGNVLCTVPIYYDCPPGFYPDSEDGVITKKTNCVQEVPYNPSSSTPEDTCKKVDKESTPRPYVQCSRPQIVSNGKPKRLPYCKE